MGKQMKGENKMLREQISELRVQKVQSVDKALDEKMGSVQKLQRQYDALHAENMKKQNALQDLDGKLSELKIDANMPTTEASPQMRQIRVLENRLDKAMIKFNEAKSINKTYEQITKRLKEERIGFDNQLSGIERTLKAKERDYEELLLLSHDAYHAKEMAQAELHRFEQGVMEERNQRDKEVQEKKTLVQQRVEMNQRLEQRERILKKQENLDRVGEQQLKGMSSSDLTAGFDQERHEAQEAQERYEEAFRRISDATGVSDVNEVIQKFLMQEQTHKNLSDLTRENQTRIDQLTEDRRKLRLQVEELKFSSGGSAGRRQAIDDFEGHLNDANEKFERTRAKYERLAKILIQMKAGIAHLGEKLTVINLEDAQNYEMSDETVVEVLQQCELRLAKLITKTRDAGEDRGQSAQLHADKYEQKLLAKSASDVRVNLVDQDQDGDDDDDDFDEDADEEVWSRKHVKYMSDQLMEKEQTRKRKSHKGKKK